MKKLFTNDRFFRETTALGALASIAYSIFGYLNYPDCFEALTINVMIAICLVVIYSSYIRHKKNVMKGMIGSVLMALLIKRILNLNMNYIPEDKVCTVLALIFTACLFANHYVINSSRRELPWAVRINQLLCMLIAITDFVWSIAWSAFNIREGNSCVPNIICAIAMPSIVFAIVCVESRLDVYKLDREVAGWTEEKGYPEGYVHEYQK